MIDRDGLLAGLVGVVTVVFGVLGLVTGATGAVTVVFGVLGLVTGAVTAALDFLTTLTCSSLL